jgi:hypothetical protein
MLPAGFVAVSAMKAVLGRVPHWAAAIGTAGSSGASLRLIGAVVLCSLALLGGCSVTAALQTEPGVDVSSVAPGATREQVEAVVGKPVKEWTSALGVRYCVYQYYGGKQPSHSNASGRVLLNIASLGFLELLYQLDADTQKRDREEGKVFPLMAVSYDAQSVVIGTFPGFTQFTALPPDGRSTTQGAPAPSPVSR